MNQFSAIAVPLDVADVDTDQILPKQFLKGVSRDGYGRYLFHNWRFQPDGSPNPDFVLNQPRYQGAGVLLARENFGCGSSREHAPWALWDYGFRVLMAPSFADIFRNNCLNTGLLALELDPELMEQWFERVQAQEGYQISLDPAQQTLTGSDGFACAVMLDARQQAGLAGETDAIEQTMAHQAAIEAYEKGHQTPWQAAVSDPGNRLAVPVGPPPKPSR